MSSVPCNNSIDFSASFAIRDRPELNAERCYQLSIYFPPSPFFPVESSAVSSYSGTRGTGMSRLDTAIRIGKRIFWGFRRQTGSREVRNLRLSQRSAPLVGLAAVLLILACAGFAAAAAHATSAPGAQPDTTAAAKKKAKKLRKLPSNAHTTSQSAAARLTHPTAHTRTVARHHHHRRPLTAHEIARTHRLRSAFVASSQLRPIA